MARLPLIDPETTTGDIRASFDRMPVKLNIFRMMAHAEANMIPAMRLGNSILHKQKLSAVNRELLILQVAQLEGGAYEWRQHVPIALGVGVTQRQIDGLERGDYGDEAFDAAQRALLAFGREVTENVRVPEPVFAAVRQHFSEQEIVETIVAIGFYMMMARLTEATETDLDPAAGMRVYDGGKTAERLICPIDQRHRDVKAERYVRPLTAESSGTAPGRGRLNGRRVLVVGGGQRTFDEATDPIGNGRAMSLLFAREGAQVAVADINLASAGDTVGRIEAEGGRAFAVQADVTQESDVRRMIDEAHRAMGGLDGMVLNVGTFGQPGLDGVSAEQWNRIYDVNVRGPMLACREALPKFDDGGSIVFISSIAALRAGSQMPVYDCLEGGAWRVDAQHRPCRRAARHPRQPGLSGSGRHAERPHRRRRTPLARQG